MTAPGHGPVGSVGAVQRLEPELHHLGLLDRRAHVRVHPRAEPAHGRRVVQRLAAHVGVVERPLDALQVAELVLDGLHCQRTWASPRDIHVLEEPVEARPRPGRTRRRRHLHAVGLDVPGSPPSPTPRFHELENKLFMSAHSGLV
jgi:hypothetical protein